MRLYVSILAALGLTASACGKKEEKKPDPATQQVKEEPKKEEPKKEEPKTAEVPKEEPKKEEPKVEEPKVEEPKTAEKAAPADRTAAVQQGFADYAAGKLDESFKFMTDDATWTEVGMPNGEFKGLAAIKEMHTKQLAGFSEVQMKIGRIIEAGEYQVVEYVWKGKNTGALPDGTAATGKEATVPGAYLAHYNDKGLVDQVWIFQDTMNTMQQLGVVPGLAEGFTPVALPETVEVVKADFNPALKDAYMAFGQKMKPDTIDAAIDEMTTDDYTMADFMTGKTVTGKAAMKEMMKKWMSMFTMDSMNADMAFGAGDYLVVVATSTMTYKGGIPGVEAKDQKVTSHALDIAKFEGGKFKSYTSYMNGLETAMGLGMMGGAAAKPEEGKAEDAKPAGEMPSFGVAACDAYMRGVMACVEKVPEAGRQAIKDGLQQTLDAWKQVAAGGDAAKAALEQGCKSALDASKQSMSALCPDVKWE